MPSSGEYLADDKRLVTTNAGTSYKVAAITTRDGTQLVRITAHKANVLIPYETFATSPRKARSLAAYGGIVIVSPSTWANIVEAVGRISPIRRRWVAEGPGWNGRDLFAYADGRMLKAGNVRVAGKAFATSDRFRARGSMSGWKREVATPLSEHILPSFLLCAGLVAPLLSLVSADHNPGFEIVGDHGDYKTFLLRLLASVAGSPAIGSGIVIPAATIDADLANVVPAFADMPLIIDEVATFGDRGGRARKMMAMAFKLSDGQASAMFDKNADRTRLVYFCSTTEPLRTVLAGGYNDTIEAAAGRLITISIRDNGGIFDSTPEEHASLADFTRSLSGGISRNYGTALPAFIKQVLDARVTDEQGLQKRIDRLMAHFRVKSGVNLDRGGDVRLADTFGLIYAAGVLARGWSILPDNFQCGKAVLAIFQLHQRASRPQPSALQRLGALLRRPDVLDVGDGHRTITDVEYNKSQAFIFHGQAGRELLLDRRQLRRHFPDWNAVKHNFDMSMYCPSPERKTVQRTIGKGKKKQHFYCFSIEQIELHA